MIGLYIIYEKKSKMSSIKIHTFDINSPEWEMDLLEWLVPMEVAYQKEFSSKSLNFWRPVNEESALRWIKGEVRDRYHFLIATCVEDIQKQYSGYTSWCIRSSWFFDSNATFVLPNFRRKWIWQQLKSTQIEYAKWKWCEWFTTIINVVNVEAYEMMKLLWCRFDKILWIEDDLIWWRVYLDF